MFRKIREYIRQSKYIEQDKEFDKLYKNIEQEIIDIERKRSKSIKNIVTVYVITIVLCILLLIINQKIYFSPIVTLIFIISIVIFLFTSLIKYRRETEEYRSKYKNNILVKVIQKINNGEVYFSKYGLPLKDYLEAGFESKETFNEYKSSDYIGIKTNKDIIHLSNIKLSKKKIVENEIKKYDIFTGMYSYVAINKKVNEIKIERSLQNVITQKEQIILDHENFEKYFNIFSKNRMQTMRVLTPEVMEKMLEFVEKNYTNFVVIIKDQKVHFKFYAQMFPPSLYFRISNKNGMENNRKYIYYYYCIFKFVIEMTEYLSNTINELDI